jgi:aspartate/methionine/tyrosine aminotransferase
MLWTGESCDEVLIPDPSFPLHALCPNVWRCSFVCSLVGEEWFRQSIYDVVPHITERSRVIILNFPNRPTGNVISILMPLGGLRSQLIMT